MSRSTVRKHLQTRHVSGAAALPADVLTVDEAAEFLRIGRNGLYEALGRGEIPHRRIGKSIRLSRAVLLRWLDGAR